MTWLLETRDITKSFAGVPILKGIGLKVAAGEVHALVGENGAGKSTLMRILMGLHQPDAGEIWFKGRRVEVRHPHAARKLGMAMIHQEMRAFGELSVAENIFMGQQPAARFTGWIDQRALHREARRLLDRLGVAIPSSRKLRELTVAETQAVEMAKALAQHAELIIMDEPTSAISAREVEALLGLIGELKQQGVAVVYISHKMGEIFRIANTVTVLRDGRQIATRPIGEVDEPRLITLMAGREAHTLFAKAPAKIGGVALAVRGLSKRGRFQNAHFEVRHGEILGLAGLMGAGRTDLAGAVYGLAPADAGEIHVEGRRARIRCPGDALRQGIAMVTEDRQRSGLVPRMSVKHNLTLASLRRWCRGMLIDRARENDLADEQIRSFSIKATHRDQEARRLSGGNQQKLVIAKALLADPAILILDEPTRGIDVGAKAEVYGIISRLALAGKAILMVSSELPEILALSDRILVMCQGRITAELDPRRTTQEEVLKFAMPG